MDCIIFSRDRACQLDLLIRSLKKYFIKWKLSNFSVLYKATLNDFKKGYEIVKSEHRQFKYYEEEDFYHDVISLMNNTMSDKFMFLVDDIIFKDYFNSECLEIYNSLFLDKQIICHSLRLCPRINYCYTTNQPMNIPVFSSDLKWNWKEQGFNDWGYPMSMDGHIFRTEDIVKWVSSVRFQSPNSQEATMDSWIRQSNVYVPVKMSCFPESKLVNIVSNRVNVDAKNRSPDNTDITTLNQSFLDGTRIKVPQIKNNMSCHIEHTYTYERNNILPKVV